MRLDYFLLRLRLFERGTSAEIKTNCPSTVTIFLDCCFILTDIQEDTGVYSERNVMNVRTCVVVPLNVILKSLFVVRAF